MRRIKLSCTGAMWPAEYAIPRIKRTIKPDQIKNLLMRFVTSLIPKDLRKIDHGASAGLTQIWSLKNVTPASRAERGAIGNCSAQIHSKGTICPDSSTQQLFGVLRAMAGYTGRLLNCHAGNRTIS